MRLGNFAGLAALAVALCPGQGAIAQEKGVCRENAYTERPVNPAKSDLWQMQFSQRDPSLMQQLAGNWYSEVTANINGAQMVNQQIQSFDANGAYGYRDQTCTVGMPQIPCSTNQGYGRWAAIAQGNGGVYVARNFSDLNRQDECAGFTAAFRDANTLVDPQTGQVLMQRANP